MLCKTLLEGNVGDSSTEKTQLPTIESTSVEIGENSKTIYINDSFDIVRIPLDTESIIIVDDTEETIYFSSTLVIGLIGPGQIPNGDPIPGAGNGRPVFNPDILQAGRNGAVTR